MSADFTLGIRQIVVTHEDWPHVVAALAKSNVGVEGPIPLDDDSIPTYVIAPPRKESPYRRP